MELNTVHLFRWDDLPKEPVTELLSRKIITGEREMIAQIWLKKGCVVPEHSHQAEQLSYVFGGGLDFTIEGETIMVRPGDVLRIPSWVKHSAVAVLDTFELDVFSPIRRDWLEHTDTYFHTTSAAGAGGGR